MGTEPSHSGRRGSGARLAAPLLIALVLAGLVLVALALLGRTPSSLEPTSSASGSAAVPSRSASGGASASAEAPEPSRAAIDLGSLSGRIAFSAGAPHAEDVYVVNADGNGLDQVTSDSAADFDPTLDPDGSRLAYRHQPGDDRTTEIFVIGLDGKNATNVSRNDGRADWGPAWSPDGSVIGWNTQPPGTSSGLVLGLAAPDGSRFRTVEPGVWVEYPAWSPDGSKIAFMSQTPEGTENYEIWVMNADGSDPLRLTDSPGPDGWPTWSPDGSQIAFASVRDDCSIAAGSNCLSTGDLGPFHTLWIMNADGSDAHRVSRTFVQIPDWSPDGAYLVFGTRRGLGIVTADGAGQGEIPLGLGAPNFPDWSR